MSDVSGLVAEVRQAARDMDWFKLGMALDRLEAAVAPVSAEPSEPPHPAIEAFYGADVGRSADDAVVIRGGKASDFAAVEGDEA